MTIQDAHQRYLRHCSTERNFCTSTLKGLKGSCSILMSLTGATELSAITEELLRDFFYQGREARQWTPKTYRGYWAYLNMFFEWCVASKRMASNPIKNIQRPKLTKALPRRLSKEDAQKILYYAFNTVCRYPYEQTRNHTIVATLLYSGIRIGELLNLKLIDVDLKSKVIMVHQGKGRKDRRVPIYTKLAPALKSYLQERDRLKKDSEYFFISVRGNKPLLYKDVCRIFRKISLRAGVSFTAHQLRHTFASEALDNGLEIYKLQQILGHSNVMTTTIYLNLATSSLQKSLDEIDFL